MMNEKNEQQTKIPHHRTLQLVAQWGAVAILSFVFITEPYFSLAASIGQSVQLINFESLQTPIVITIIVLILIGVAYILYSSGPSKDGAWTIMTGPYVR